MTHRRRQYPSLLTALTLLFVCIFFTCCSSKENASSSSNFPNEARASLRRPAHSTSIRHGKILYDYYCAGCHGDNARGNGPDSEEEGVPAPNLISLLEAGASADELDCTNEFAKLQYHGQLKSDELLEMASYVRSLP